MNNIITTPETEWAQIPSYPTYYASRSGQISRKMSLTPMKLVNCHGYLVAQLYVPGGAKRVRVHRLVAEAFLGPCPGKGYEVNHKNLVTTDNRVDNLEWVNAKNNMRHFFNELKKAGKKLMPQKLGAYNPSTGEFQQWPSMCQAAKFFGVNDSTMCGHAIDYHGGKRLYKGWQLYKLDDDWNICDSVYPLKTMLKDLQMNSSNAETVSPMQAV